MLKFIYTTIILSAFTLVLKAQPSFKGGETALNNFLTKNIIYPDYSRRNCIAAVIRVAFRVDESGKVSEVKVQQGLGIDLDDEAVRVIKMTSGKWQVPAGSGGAARLVLPVRFTPDYSLCRSYGTTNTINTEAAIASYQIRQEQENAVTNYYINKYKGTANSANEASIIALKDQLGIDEEFLNSLLEQADKKLKQGDKEGACTDWNFIKNTGSNLADKFISQYCGK